MPQSSCPAEKKFRKLVNMSAKEIRKWAKNPTAKKASFPATRKRLPHLAALVEKPGSKWTTADCKLAKRVVAFNSRMSGVVKKHGCTEKAVISLRNWGHQPPKCGVPAYSKPISKTRAQKIAKYLHIDTKKISMAQFRRGLEVEQEHTKNLRKAAKIALDHLRERRDYYTRLKRAEKG